MMSGILDEDISEGNGFYKSHFQKYHFAFNSCLFVLNPYFGDIGFNSDEDFCVGGYIGGIFHKKPLSKIPFRGYNWIGGLHENIVKPVGNVISNGAKSVLGFAISAPHVIANKSKELASTVRDVIYKETFGRFSDEVINGDFRSRLSYGMEVGMQIAPFIKVSKLGGFGGFNGRNNFRGDYALEGIPEGLIYKIEARQNARSGFNFFERLGKGINGESQWRRMTNKEATEAAKKLGFEPTNHLSRTKQKIFYNKKTKTYISADADGYNGGIWKQAKSVEDIDTKATRMGTYDANLNKIGD